MNQPTQQDYECSEIRHQPPRSVGHDVPRIFMYALRNCDRAVIVRMLLYPD
jgi:hypothetical protein